MAIELKVPSVGESITEVQIGEWLKNEGDSVQVDETIATLDTEKTTVEVPAPQSGTISKIIKNAGEIANVGDVIALLEAGSGAAGSSADGAAQTARVSTSDSNSSPSAEAEANGAPETGEKPSEATGKTGGFVMPSAQRVLSENGASAENVGGSGPGGRITKSDAQNAVAQSAVAQNTNTQNATTSGAESSALQVPTAAPLNKIAPVSEEPVVAGADEDVVPMTMLRRKISEHLVNAQQNAALLTTFNEIDMTNVMQIRKEMQDAFTKKYEVKLGFMSFFIKAAVDALKMYPGINAEIRGTNIVYRNHYDIGVAIGGGKGLVVPVLKRAEHMSFSEIEVGIGEFAKRARANALKPHELMGGTFTITNGGVYGSLLSTPIVNAPQSGILGMHTIQQRPIALDGQVVIRPMMYVALTYDHRIVDGREAVGFLMRIKECIENPTRMLVEA